MDIVHTLHAQCGVHKMTAIRRIQAWLRFQESILQDLRSRPSSNGLRKIHATIGRLYIVFTVNKWPRKTPALQVAITARNHHTVRSGCMAFTVASGLVLTTFSLLSECSLPASASMLLRSVSEVNAEANRIDCERGIRIWSAGTNYNRGKGYMRTEKW